MLEQLAELIAVVSGLYAGWRFLVRRYRAHKGGRKKNEAYALIERFITLFNAHGIERTQIPRFIGEKYLTLADVSTDEKLLHKLSESVMSAVCELFGVQREWLDGKDVPIYPVLNYYKDMESYLAFMAEINGKYEEIRAFAFKAPEDKLEKSGKRFPIALIFRASVGEIGEERIYRYFIIGDEWSWEYPRARVQFKAMVFVALKFKVYITGFDLLKGEIDKLIWGQLFPGPVLTRLSHITWHPDDYIFTSKESAVAKDDEEALEARELIRRDGLMMKLEVLTDSIGDVVKP